MPPRKRARVSEAATPDVQVGSTSPEATITNDEELLNDSWTDEEETALFKGLIKWKPTGIHKHFRMIQLHGFLLENHYIHPRSEHTKIPGIWKKLASLYDLDSLDQREDARQLSDLSDEEDEDEEDQENVEDIYSIAANKIHKSSFYLPEEDFNEEMWKNRLASDKAQRDESPPSLPELNLAVEPPIRFTPAISIEPEESSAPVAKRRGRPPGSGNKNKSVGRPSMRSRRQTGSVAQEDEEKEDDEEEDDESEDEDEDEEEDEEDDEEEEKEVTTRKGRNQGRSSRGRPRKRGKG